MRNLRCVFNVLQSNVLKNHNDCQCSGEDVSIWRPMYNGDVDSKHDTANIKRKL